MEEFAKQRDTLREQMLNQKRGEIFSEYVASTRRRMEADGSIKVYQDVVERIDGPPESGLPPGMPAGFPGGGMPGGAPGGQVPFQVPPGGAPAQ
jgi:hypothetical protein